MVEYSWLIPLFPLLSFVLIVFFLNRNNRVSSYFAIAMILTSMVLSFKILVEVLANPHPYEAFITWLSWTGFSLPMGIYIDPLAAVMLIVVTIVSSLVHIYSLGYMHGDPRFARFFAYLSLFSFSMLGLVIAGSYVLILVFWELVGLTSYFLIGFWFEKKIAADAGKKAFVTTKLADLGFLLGLVLMIFVIGTATLPELNKKIESLKITAGMVEENHSSKQLHNAEMTVHEGVSKHHKTHNRTGESHEVGTATHGKAISKEDAKRTLILIGIAGLLMFMGACGKSAQFPFHVWLPDAMEGPTPVSALIHAATMVAAGVYLTARLMGVILISPTMGLVVASIGTITAFMAATIGLVQNDIKRVLAYSTISQLGYMMMVLGLGGYTAGTFHLYTHAFFKALLFLAAGSVIHAVHTNDIQEMGGLHKKMKITSITFLIASLSISGIFPFSGFWSKDEIFAVAFEGGHYVILVIGILVAFMTAFYMFRLYFMTFTGKPRDQHAYDHAHESPYNMTVPLMIFALLSIFAGWWGIPWLHTNYASFVFFGHPHHVEPNMILMLISLVVALSGIGLAYLMYYKRAISPETMAQRFKPIYTLLFNKYYFDEIYMAIIINPTYRLMEILFKFDQIVIDGMVNGVGKLTLLWSWAKERFDTYVVDGAVNGVGHLSLATGRAIRKTQTGQLQTYALVIFLGAVVLIFMKFI
ncbi:MAG: NADH-quinone oxidoreductase subunit L [candidate division Zixibacteria bacterium 4484_95]|nr:MAG: NADH-quinone oxidoreductase subunit L [candidate division Zixibacteria bacterium 4484_95]